MKKKRTLLWILIILLEVAVLIAVLSIRSCKKNKEQQPTKPTDGTESTAVESMPDGTEATVPQETEPAATEPSETVPPETTPPATEPPVEEKPPVVNPPAPTEPVEPEKPEPVRYDPAQVLSAAKEQIKSTSGTEVAAIDNPKKLTIQVPATQDVATSAQAIASQIMDQLGEEQAQIAPNVTGGTFTYNYNLVYQGTVDDQYVFVFSYRAIRTNYVVTEHQYDTNQLVKDVCAYLDGLGKVKFDSYGASNARTSSVIVLLEYDYETALSIVKAQVESFTAAYRNYDFYFSSLTITTKGGVEKQALLFVIAGS